MQESNNSASWDEAMGISPTHDVLLLLLLNSCRETVKQRETEGKGGIQFPSAAIMYTFYDSGMVAETPKRVKQRPITRTLPEVICMWNDRGSLCSATETR